jgi:hypothetical protein
MESPKQLKEATKGTPHSTGEVFYEEGGVGVPTIDDFPAAPHPSHAPASRTALGIDSPPALTGADRDSFQRFWTAYPKKLGYGNAQRAWCATVTPKVDTGDDDLPSRILAAVEAQSGSELWMKEGRRFVPTPARWLTEERWNDQLPRWHNGHED